ncbi:hypothetical protein A6V29_03080 [Blastococcus sp. CCUG 61487]|nr:hypothetical protein A6V29_03080 [Blastococcus sp. CCUG 61487]
MRADTATLRPSVTEDAEGDAAALRRPRRWGRRLMSAALFLLALGALSIVTAGVAQAGDRVPDRAPGAAVAASMTPQAGGHGSAAGDRPAAAENARPGATPPPADAGDSGTLRQRPQTEPSPAPAPAPDAPRSSQAGPETGSNAPGSPPTLVVIMEPALSPPAPRQPDPPRSSSTPPSDDGMQAEHAGTTSTPADVPETAPETSTAVSPAVPSGATTAPAPQAAAPPATVVPSVEAPATPPPPPAPVLAAQHATGATPPALCSSPERRAAPDRASASAAKRTAAPERTDLPARDRPADEPATPALPTAPPPTAPPPTAPPPTAPPPPAPAPPGPAGSHGSSTGCHGSWTSPHFSSGPGGDHDSAVVVAAETASLAQVSARYVEGSLGHAAAGALQPGARPD